MSNSLDLTRFYRDWLEIPADRLPPNHYALLGVKDFEADIEVIEAAAKARGAYLHQLASGPERKTVQELLNQVAVAKRTLLSPEQRASYDRSIVSPTIVQTSDAQPANGETEPEALNGPASRRSESKTSSKPKSSGARNLQVIGISALSLILVGGYWLTRDRGVRRAAEARKLSDDSVGSSSESIPRKSASAAKSGAVSAPRESPVVARKRTGSGLGSGMDSKFGDMFSDIESQSSKVASELKSKQQGFRPLAGISIGPVETEGGPGDWPDRLDVIEAFPNSLEDRFRIDGEAERYAVELTGIRIEPDESGDSFQLIDQKRGVLAGDAVAITATMPVQEGVSPAIAISIAGIQIGLKSFGEGVEVFAKDHIEGAKPNGILKLVYEGGEISLLVGRDPSVQDRLFWKTRVGDQVHFGTVDGTILDEEASVAVVITAPEKSVDPPLSLHSIARTALLSE
ncbi:J domain-containing protein [Rhodopirellula sp. MGV]|uniref:J domain-containing protein n=1 Tax=Rhodopirellula sp. MGV TaxID=2023130 RepID=UPI000B97BEF6|nr:hypothetical protein [Rhodopirellula sp. MGV]OYP35242.1 hypothetical protein CGZ80_12670 [Rhodopirellula sp. MGV]PNY35668.1 hypothetical protein C2E31_17025 [Rhodopirellula baltica]